MKSICLTSKFLVAFFLIAFAPSIPHAQDTNASKIGGDVLFPWDTQCMEKGCILFTDVLRGVSDGPSPDPKDTREYITIAVALDRVTRLPAYFAFHIPPFAQQDQGVFIAFAVTTMDRGQPKTGLDKDGATRILFDSCDKDSCVVRVSDGLITGGKNGRSIDLLQKFLDSDHVMFLYLSNGKAYRTMIPLSPFKKEYQRVMTSELPSPNTKN